MQRDCCPVNWEDVALMKETPLGSEHLRQSSAQEREEIRSQHWQNRGGLRLAAVEQRFHIEKVQLSCRHRQLDA
jgi:hypothetical protein